MSSEIVTENDIRDSPSLASTKATVLVNDTGSETGSDATLQTEIPPALLSRSASFAMLHINIPDEDDDLDMGIILPPTPVSIYSEQRTALHSAVIAGDVNAVKKILSIDTQENIIPIEEPRADHVEVRTRTFSTDAIWGGEVNLTRTRLSLELESIQEETPSEWNDYDLDPNPNPNPELNQSKPSRDTRQEAFIMPMSPPAPKLNRRDTWPFSPMSPRPSKPNSSKNFAHLRPRPSPQCNHPLNQSLEKNALSFIDAQEEHGYTPLMNAVVLELASVSLAITQLLVEAGASLQITDKEGFSVLHWAAVGNHVSVLEYLLSCNSCPNINVQCKNYETPLHRTCRVGRIEALHFLLKAGADPLAKNNLHQTPMDVAGVLDSKLFTKVRDSIRKELFVNCQCCRTLVLHHEDSKNHLLHNTHQESPERIDVVLNALQNEKAFQIHELEFDSNFDKCGIDAVCRVHYPEYAASVQRLALGMHRPEAPNMVPFTPHVQKTIGFTDDKVKKKSVVLFIY